MEEQISRLWYIHAMECYLALGKNELLVANTTWTNHTDVIRGLRKSRHKSKHAGCMQQLGESINGDKVKIAIIVGG